MMISIIGIAFMENCIFCKIINKEEPSDFVYENDKFIVIKDINSKAPIPKKHIHSVNHFEEGDKELIGEMILCAKKIAKEKNLAEYKLLINVGRKAGQMVDHIHIHLLSGNF